MPLKVIENDITQLEVDVIVNAANKELLQGGGVCGAIFKAAGAKQLQAACDEIGICGVGEAVMTDAFDLRAKKIIHTVGPIWQGGNANEARLLENCYTNALKLAYKNGYQSIAFPLISSGIYGYPVEAAFRVAVSTIREFLLTHKLFVYLVIYDQKGLHVESPKHPDVSAYIEAHYEYQHFTLEHQEESIVLEAQVMPFQPAKNLEELLENVEESFAEKLFSLIDDREMTDVETYKKANIDRRLFSKIRNVAHYTPLKKTVLSFAIALELNIEETLDLLESAGYTLSKSSKFDLIVRYFIEREVYDLYKINETLFDLDEVLLGS